MPKALRHLESPQEAAQALDRVLRGQSWYVSVRVEEQLAASGAVADRRDRRGLVVTVRNLERVPDHLRQSSVFNSWPLRFLQGG